MAVYVVRSHYSFAEHGQCLKCGIIYQICAITKHFHRHIYSYLNPWNKITGLDTTTNVEVESCGILFVLRKETCLRKTEGVFTCPRSFWMLGRLGIGWEGFAYLGLPSCFATCCVFLKKVFAFRSQILFEQYMQCFSSVSACSICAARVCSPLFVLIHNPWAQITDLK